MHKKLKIWFAEWDLLPGINARKKVHSSIQGSSVIIFVISKNSFLSSVKIDSRIPLWDILLQ